MCYEPKMAALHRDAYAILAHKGTREVGVEGGREGWRGRGG